MRGGSGFRGDADRWRRARRIIVEAIDHNGTFLDIGCANGLLMESIAAWACEEGHTIEPYGLELSPAIAELARRRLPAWQDRIFAGDVTTWRPLQRFDFVRTELVYVPDAARHQLVVRCLDYLIAPGGRLIICSYGSATRPPELVGSQLRSWGFTVAGEAGVTDSNGVLITRIAWVDRGP